MTGKTRRICGGRLAAAVVAHLIYMAAAGPASAMQILEAADHGELAAEISATGVNRIALSHDRIRRVIRAPGGFVTEHDPETGELYLRPVAAGQGAEPEAAGGSDGAPVILFIGTEKGFTYRLTLTPSDRDSAQILIRNGAALTRAEAGAAVPATGADPRIGVRGRPRVAALVGLIRAVARREPPAGYAIETGTGRVIGGLPVIETWRGPRLTAHVVEDDGAVADAADLAGTMGVRAAAAWLAAPGSGPSGGRLAVIVTDAAGPNDAMPAERNAGRRNAGRRIPGRPAMSAVDGDAGAVRRRQLVLFSVIAAVVLVVLAVWLTAGGGGQPAVQGGIEAELAGPDIAEKVWTRRSEARIGTIETRLREIETEARRLGSENERLRQKLAGDAANARSVIDRQAAVIDALERQMNAPPPAETPDGTGFFRPAESQAGTPAANPAPAPPAPLIETFELKDAGSGATGPGAAGPGIGGLSGAAVKPVGVWLPAGSHAEAVVLSGVDASAGVSSQGDPRPVLFRITGPAWTAAENGAAMQVDVAGCTVTGAAHGDLSSEKIYARLRTMTCAGPGFGTVIETDVAGFVAGSGKVGVRGPVVSREGALVEKAFLAGLVSSLGQGVSQAFQPQAVATGGGAALANSGLGDIGRAGLGSGAASAGQKVADYMIRRAEQYQPVIQLGAGTRVTLVFLEGARLDGQVAVKSAAKSNQGGN